MNDFQLIPAIDIKDGQCVRLRQGQMDAVTLFGTDPGAVAQRWLDAGARRIHVVDLDGAVAGAPRNRRAVEAIIATAGPVPVQLGGGVRSVEVARAYVELGIDSLIIGTQAVRQPEFVTQCCAMFPGQVMVGLDARDGYVAVDGWTGTSAQTAVALGRQFAGQGVSAIVYTDIAKDGMLQGPNLDATQELAAALEVPVIASGGVSAVSDVMALSELRSEGVIGAIVGRALYQGNIDLRAALLALGQA